ncbi:MAG: extracellular solute-binding protein [Pseudomonadota bacterium]
MMLTSLLWRFLPVLQRRPGSFSASVAVWCVALSFGWAPAAWAAHALAQFGEPKYPAGFTHFDYANPTAPRGGRLVLSTTAPNTHFDKLNPFSLRGRAAPGLLELVFETLTVYSLDEVNTQYGLLAQDIEFAKDGRSVTFRLHPKARFSNGDAVTAEDVRHSFSVLTGRLANPKFKAYFSEIDSVTVVDRLSVRFDFKRQGRDLSFIAGSLPVFSPKWGVDAQGNPVAFDKLRMEPPVASGPYQVERAQGGADIRYRRNLDYWGAALPVRKGSFNFDTIEHKLYKDRATQVSALRAREYNFFSETQMRYWCCQYIGKHFDSGELVKEVLPHSNPPSMNGWVLNLRRERFNDPRVREALNLALDFEWINQKIFDNEFRRVQSYFSGTPLAATGLPSEAELKVLAPYRSQLPAVVFGPMFEQPRTEQPTDLRRNLTRALALFAEAGWTNRDGVLRNARGEAFTLEVAGTRNQSPYLDPIYRNLGQLGVVVNKKLADAATTRRRMNDFDFDYTSVSLREARMPGAELWRHFNSQDADVPGSENVAGVRSPVVDALIRKVLDAQSQAELEVNARALDRVLIHGHYVIPWRYLTRHYLIHHRDLERPQQLPTYYSANDWASQYWWSRPEAPDRQAGVALQR